MAASQQAVPSGRLQMPSLNQKLPDRFDTLPVELVLKIMEQMSPRDLINFVLSQRQLLHIFRENRETVMVRVLKALPEFELLLFIETANEAELHMPGWIFHPRLISYVSVNPDKPKANLTSARVEFNNGQLICPRKVVFTMSRLIGVWRMALDVDWWVDHYPAIRWRDHPEDRRCLRVSEETRLRKAIGRWWLYAVYFHGNYLRDSNAPQKWSLDNRLHHLRILQTNEICELDELYDLIWETISKDLCSSVKYVTSRLYGTILEMVPWGEADGSHANIVNTYMKLNPQELRHFLILKSGSGRNKLDKLSLIRSVCRTNNHFGLDRESLSFSIRTVLQERLMLTPRDVITIPPMGILDGAAANEDDRHAWSNGACPDGRPPLSEEVTRAFPPEYNKSLVVGDTGRRFFHHRRGF